MGQHCVKGGGVLRGVKFVYIISIGMMSQPSILCSTASCMVNRRPILIGGWLGIGSSWSNHYWTLPSYGFPTSAKGGILKGVMNSLRVGDDLPSMDDRLDVFNCATDIRSPEETLGALC